MNNQPTLKEYILYSSDNVVMGRGEQFFLMKLSKSLVYKILKALLYIFFGMAIPLASHISWYNFSFDMFVLWQLMLLIFKKFEYQRSNYEIIKSNDVEYHKDISWLLTRKKRDIIVPKLFLGVILVFLIANSFTALYIRSLCENQFNLYNMNLSVSGDDDKEVRIMDCEELSELHFSDQPVTHLYLNVKMSGKPISFHFKLNGHPITDLVYNERYIGWIWSEYVFEQYYFISYDVNSLPNNSVLEISSGSFSRQWNIKTIE